MTSTLLTCTSSTRPASPSAGDTLFETDTDKIIVYSGSDWKVYDSDGTAVNDADITVGTNQVTGLGGAAEKDLGTGGSDVAAGNHTHAAATTSAAGFMSTADKTKLDGLGTNLVSKKTFDITWGTDDTATPKKFEFSGSGASKYCTITHDLSTQYVMVSVIESNEVGGEVNFVYLPGEQVDMNYDFIVTPHSTSALKLGLANTATSAITDGTIFKVAIIG